jgi:glucuronate isomerase
MQPGSTIPSPAATDAKAARSRRLVLDPDRFFDADPAVRRVAREIYQSTRDLPLVCPHGHVDPALLATDAPFPEPTALLITPDHYLLRMLYSQGVSMESLGVPARDGAEVESDPRRIWQRFADRFYLFRGTPSGVWLDHELHELFGIRLKLDGGTAQGIYDEIAEKLASPEFRPRALFDRFNIEVLATTDHVTDPLDAHRAIRESDWSGRVIPTYRPDALFRIASPGWRAQLESLEKATGMSIAAYPAFVEALADRRRYFKSFGATATDHAVVEPRTEWMTGADLSAVFGRAIDGKASPDDQRRFEAHLLMEMARLSTADGLVMQLHPGSLRDHHTRIVDRFGPDKGADIPVATEFTRNLRPLLNEFGAHPNFTLIVFTLDETTYSRELAPLAGHYPALRLGPPWWFHDSIEGMRRYRAMTTETAGIWNTAGFNDDTRAFCSIPARHDLSRRVDADFLAGQVARHILDLDDALVIARALAHDLALETYRLDDAAAD